MALVLIGVGLFLYAEFWFLGVVADQLGGWTTFLTLLLTVILGGKMVKQAGLATLGNMAIRLQNHEPAGVELVEGGLLLGAGALFIFPGFISDALAVLLLLPPLRRLAAYALIFAFRQRRTPGKPAFTQSGEIILEGEVCHSSDPPPPPPRLPSPDL